MKLRKEIDNYLKTSYRVREILIPSRFFLAPINTGFSLDGEPLEELINFHKERSGKNIGITYIGNVSVGAKYVTNKNTAYFTDNIEKWSKLVKEISNEGSLPGIQIACRNSNITPLRKMINKDKATHIQKIQQDIVNIHKSEIEKIISLFIECAVKAHNLGFKVIQIHAAHGYFLSQMLNPNLNVRKDEFGKNTYEVLIRIVEGIRNQLSDDVLLDIRISLIDGLLPEEAELQYKETLIHNLVQLDIDMISFSNGIYDLNKQLIYPLKQWGHAVFIDKIIPYASQYPNILWNYAGNIWDLDELFSKSIPNNLTFSLGRALIADPYFVQKSINNEKQKINSCERKNQCHYYSLGKSNIDCPIYEISRTKYE